MVSLQPGDYVWVRVTEAKAQTLFCDEILGRSSVREFAAAVPGPAVAGHGAWTRAGHREVDAGACKLGYVLSEVEYSI